MKNQLVMMFLLFCLFSACDREPLKGPRIDRIYNPNPDFEVAWHYEFNKDNEGLDSTFYNSEPLIVENDIFVAFGSTALTEDDFLCKFNKVNGELHWKLDIPKYGATRALFTYEEDVIVNVNNSLFWVDNTTGEIKHSLNFFESFNECIIPNVSLFENYLYINISDCKNPYQEYNTMKRLNLDNLEIEEVVTYTSEANNSPSLNKPNIFRNSENQIVLIFGLTYFQTQSSESTVHLIRYNLSKNTEEWRIENIDSHDINHVAPLINDNQVFMVGAFSVFAIDINEGTIVWENKLPGATLPSFTNIEPIIYEDKIIVKPYSREIAAFNILTGNLDWYLQNSPIGHMDYWVEYNGLLYTVADGGFFTLQPLSGNIKYQTDQSPINNYKGFYRGGLKIDPSGDIFMHDELSFMRVHLKEI